MASSGLARATDRGSAVTGEQMNTVIQAIRETPIIDNHAHPLLKLEAIDQHSLLSIVSEAHGDAIKGSVTSLPHQRAVQQLSVVLGCDATWESVQAAIKGRRRDDYTAWVAKCLSGIEAILLDDGLSNAEDAHVCSWHDGFTRSKCRRIVRIETIAAEIISSYCVEPKKSQYTTERAFIEVLKEFDDQIQQSLSDPNVVGFKSVICYRTGLDIPAVADTDSAQLSLASIITSHSLPETRFHRLQHDGLNDLLVHRTAELIGNSPGNLKKPIQFHTGLGDNDITLTKSSPAHLQEFIRTYPTVPIVLLHTGYPHARDAGYLATVYDNVYVDVGEVFPVVARHGQEAAVRQIFELCPWTKIMWSTDGHWFPETYLLAILQSREVLETVICDFVQKGDLSCQAAVQLVQNILFCNASKVYNLGLELPSPKGFDTVETKLQRPKTSSPEKYDLGVWKAFTSTKGEPAFVRISWLDYTSMPRMRMIPFKRFNRLVVENKPLDIGITKAALGLLQHDHIINTATPTGEYRLHPDFSSLRLGPIDGHVNMYGNFHEKNGANVSLCPRTQLIRSLELSAEQNISYLVGFEIEFVLLERTKPGSALSMSEGRYTMLENDGHMWSSSRFYVDKKLPQLLRDIVGQLDQAGIEVEQLHSESAPGQFELILPAKPPLEAVDTLLLVRDTIASLATDAGYKFTLHPKPYRDACGTASHVHMSLSNPYRAGDDKSVYEPFYASILEHLPALMAFTYPNPASYERMVDGAWAGGRWVAWGTQNRETPLRKIEDSHWELKSFDGLANPYLALAALFYVGVYGIADQTQLTLSDCTTDPAGLMPEERRELGITTMLPASLDEALAALADDHIVSGLIGRDVVERYIEVKRAELSLYSSMHAHEFREWITERY
ncbi:glutamine synthetase-like protein [Ophiostoma piceae UAMH 11346]|uniref:Glutamine synthetase n=1 Tax=Ophiostoma piceae (strain UAMH 11346) TaxID=1262450 RepID=S3C8A3_OPHP1|nr:glutamine synthetase-like protein [Ophiostoma piceae UAMH 11346]